MKEKYLNYVSLFSGGGIGTINLKKLGFTCICTNEVIEKRLEIQKYNNICENSNAYVCGDIRDNKIKKQIHGLLNKNKIDLLIATPPCQGMSVANHKKKSSDLERNSLVLESINFIKKYKPSIFIFENVRGFMKAICTDTDSVNRPIHEVIERNLLRSYKFSFKILNLGEYGSHSNRTRCIMIGCLKSKQEINVEELFPEKKEQKILRNLIFDLPRLKEMGTFDPSDLCHNFKAYDEVMMKWIEKTKPGESAFDQTDKSRIPARIIDGKRVLIKNKNADKYKRCDWDKPMPCIHTRNDILASQATIHPEDNRVFSIRELMILMNIPKNFKWFKKIPKSNEEKKILLKKNEMNIRSCIGEGVPSIIFSKICKKIKSQLSICSLTLKAIRDEEKNYSNINDSNWKEFRKVFFKKYNYYELSR